MKSEKMFQIEKFTEVIEKQTSPEPFSGVVFLTSGEEVTYQQGFGYAIRSERIPNQRNTRFQMASGCKIFTSVAICQLVERGKLAFESLLRDCVDVKFSHYAPDISIQHLLTHCSGIRSYFEEDINPDYEALWQDLPQYKVRGPKDFLPLFQNKAMKFLPGGQFEYNDGGYILLGLVIESVSDLSFGEFIQKNVFDRAGMQDSGYFATDQLPERTAYAYIQNTDRTWRTNFFAVPIVGAPDGGAYTTAPDMHRFWKTLNDKKLLNDELTELVLSSHITTSLKAPHSHYGLGVWIDQTEERVRKFFVEGYDPGVSLRSCVYPNEGKTLTVIGNTAEALWPLYPQLEDFLGLN